ncbi:MAG TPA: sigma-70 family RNA polymerase sigma factor [Terriglobales bacterium]|nr:sigma-70 family RNA polymerase sigma factor [Terriglobales bacterium]
MQNASAYFETSASLEIMNAKGAAQELRSTLSTTLPSFYRSAYRLLGNAADAEDAVQDAMLAAYKHLDQFKGRSQMSTWLTAIVQNSARMQLRKRLRNIHVSLDEPIADDPEKSLLDRLADDRPTPEDQCQNAELNKRLRHFSTQLSPTLLRTFQLRVIEGLSIRETATLLGLPKGTVKAQLARARKRLKQLARRALVSRPRNATNAYRQRFVV